MIYHDVVRLYISVHYAFAVTEVESLMTFVSHYSLMVHWQPRAYLEQLKYVVSHIVIHKFWVETSKVRIVDVFKYEGRGLALAISHDIQQRNDIRPA